MNIKITFSKVVLIVLIYAVSVFAIHWFVLTEPWVDKQGYGVFDTDPVKAGKAFEAMTAGLPESVALDPNKSNIYIGHKAGCGFSDSPEYAIMKCFHCDKRLYVNLGTLPTGDYYTAMSCQECFNDQ